jgi:hypothetical protein
MAAAGLSVQKVEFGTESFTITATIDSGRHVWFDGLACKGSGDAMRCPEFKITSRWQFGTPQEASEIAESSTTTIHRSRRMAPA